MNRSYLALPSFRGSVAIVLLLCGCVMNIRASRWRVIDDRRIMDQGIGTPIERFGFGAGTAAIEGASLLPVRGRVGYLDTSILSSGSGTGTVDGEDAFRFFTAQFVFAPLVITRSVLSDDVKCVLTCADDHWVIRSTEGGK